MCACIHTLRTEIIINVDLLYILNNYLDDFRENLHDSSVHDASIQYLSNVTVMAFLLFLKCSTIIALHIYVQFLSLIRIEIPII